MSASKLAVATELLAAVKVLDTEAALACVHPRATMNEAESLPWGGTLVGVDGFMKIFDTMNKVASLTVEGTELWDGDSQIISRIALRLTAHSTGEELRMHAVEIYSIDDGLVTDADVYFKDTKALCDFLSRNARPPR